MKFNSIQNSFNFGELSRHVKGRTDVEEYYKGCEELTNFIPFKQGGATFRPGTYISDNYWALNISEDWIIHEFTPRDNESYLVALNPSLGADQIAITRVNGGGLCAVSKDLYIWNQRVDFKDSTKAYNPNTTPALVGITHEQLLDSLQIVQQSDTLIIFDGTGTLAPIVILRTSSGNFVVDSMIFPQQVNTALGEFYLNSPVSRMMRVPYKDSNINPNIRLRPSATSGSAITIFAEDGGASPLNFFTGDVVGMFVKITITGGTGAAYITAKVSDSQVTAQTYITFGGTTASSNFEVAAWNPVDGYPMAAGFFEGRLITGGNKKLPDSLWCSNIGNIYHFMQRRLVQDATSDATGLNYYGDVKVTDPFNFIPAAVGANAIQWIYPSDTLLVGTTSTEFSISGSENNPLSISSIFVKDISTHGSSKTQPIKIGSSVLFVSHDGKRLLEIPKRLVEYNSATDLTLVADGIVDKALAKASANLIGHDKNKIVKLAWQENEGVLWVLCRNPWDMVTALVSCTFDKNSKIIAWAKHELADKPYISSICCIPDNTKGGYNRLFLFMKRSSGTDYSLEFMSLRGRHDALINIDPENADTGGKASFYMDATKKAQSVAGDTITLSTLQTASIAAGSTYSVFATPTVLSIVGEYLGDFVESAGTITVPGQDFTGRGVFLGLKYEGEVKPMPIEAGAQFGVAQGSARRSHEISVYVDRSLGGSYHQSKTNDDFPIVEDKLGASEHVLYSGEIRLSVNSSTDDYQTVINQKQPYPLTVLWLLTKGYTYDA